MHKEGVVNECGYNISDVPNHEFPSTFDLVMRADSSVRSPSEVTYLQTSTFLMVGQVPVQFGRSNTHTHTHNVSLALRSS